MQITGIGRILFWQDGSLWIGLSVTPVDLHAHHAIQIGLGVNAPVQFRPDASAPWAQYPAAVIPPNLPHCFQSPGKQVANIFVEPESLRGHRIIRRFGSGAIAGLAEVEAQSL